MAANERRKVTIACSGEGRGSPVRLTGHAARNFSSQQARCGHQLVSNGRGSSAGSRAL